MELSFQNQTLTLPSDRPGRVDSILFSQVDRFRFAARGGRLETRNIIFPQSRFKIGRVDSTGHEIALTEENGATLLFPQHGRVRVRAGRRDWDAGDESILALRPGKRETEVQRSATEDARAYFLILPYAQLVAAAEDRGDPERLFEGQLGAQLRGPAAGRLRAYLTFAIEDLMASSAQKIPDRTIHGLLTLIEDLLHDLLDTSAEESLPDRTVSAAAQARRAQLALDILSARSDEPLSIAELARELGMGIRSLQILFLKVYGVGPREMLNRIRLDLARQRLLKADPDAQVTSIALDCGFTHLGRFSEAYRRAFGERPVDTLRRKRTH